MSPLAVSGAYSRANALSRQQYPHPGASWRHPRAISPTGPHPCQVDPITRTKINPVLIDAGTDTFHVREVTLLHPMDRCRHLDRSGDVQAIEPFGIRAAPLCIEVLSNLGILQRKMASFSSRQRLQPQAGGHILIIRRLGIQLFELATRPAVLPKILVDLDPLIPDRPKQLPGTGVSFSMPSARRTTFRYTLRSPRNASSSSSAGDSLSTTSSSSSRRSLSRQADALLSLETWR